MSGGVEVVQIGFSPNLVKYMSVANLTLLVCDYLYTLELEVSLIWPRKWNFVKLFFFFARYSPFIDLPVGFIFEFNRSKSLEFLTRVCSRLDRANIWLTTIGIMSTEAVLVIRTYGLLGCPPRYLIPLIAQYTVLSLAVFVIVGLCTQSWTYEAPPIWSHGCFLARMPERSHLIFLAFIMLLTHEIIVMGITVYIGYTKYLDQKQTSPLLKIMYRDGTLYFVLIFLVSLANIVNIVSNSQANSSLFVGFQRVIHSILAGRIILQARKAASNVEEPCEAIPSDLHFVTRDATDTFKIMLKPYPGSQLPPISGPASNQDI